MSEDSKQIKKVKERVAAQQRSAWDANINEKQLSALSDDYKDFLSSVKTERDCIAYIKDACEESGAVPIDEMSSWTPGAFVYYATEKLLFLAQLQSDPVDGIGMTVAHCDSPRLDLKPQPLYEEEGLALAKTHYYGGVKKYQWAAIPLALHGAVVTANGEEIAFTLGEEADDPVFTIADLLPHLAQKQMDKKMKEAIAGESLNIVVGNQPLTGDGADRIKTHVLQQFDEKYGVTESDFVSAEVEAVPAFAARDVGIDRSMIGAYGHDDRIHCYTTLHALLETTASSTAVAAFVDREEIGSEGETGAKSQLFEHFLTQLISLYHGSSSFETTLECLAASTILSTDVTAAVNPHYADVWDTHNAPRLGSGPVITKYTGAGGKYKSSEASAAFVGKIRGILDDQDIPWQTGELGKVDEGGGGTVAMFFANRGASVLDFGASVLGMHSPFEIASKADLYWTKAAIAAFFAAD